MGERWRDVRRWGSEPWFRCALGFALTFAGISGWGADSSPSASLFQQVANFELDFLQAICQLKADELASLRTEMDQKVKEITTQIEQNGEVAAQVKLNPGFRFQKGVTAETHPLAYLDQSLHTFFLRQLADDHRDAYQREWVSRETFCAETIVANLLERLTGRLRLSPSQQDQLHDGLVAWAKHYVHMTSYILGNPEMIPTLPNDLMHAHLDSGQRSVWGSLRKQDLNQVPVEQEVQLRFSLGVR